jgi:predicted RND superfamily exporter protein
LLEEWPETAAGLASLRARALANPLYVDLMLSSDATLTCITIDLEAYSTVFDANAAFDESDERTGADGGEPDRLSGTQEREAVVSLHEILDRYEAPESRIYAGGAPVLNTILVNGMLLSDIMNFTALSIAIIALMLSLLFRRVSSVLVPLLVATLSLLGTVGLMGMLQIPLMPVSEVVPTFLLSVGVGSTVYLLVIAFRQLRQGASHKDAVAYALGHSGLPIVMTSLTTAGGGSSAFAAAERQPIAAVRARHRHRGKR